MWKHCDRFLFIAKHTESFPHDPSCNTLTCLTQSQLWLLMAHCIRGVRWGRAFKLAMSRPGGQSGPIQIMLANFQRRLNVPVK